MDIEFNSNEVFEMAQRLEERGQQFYLQLSQSTNDESVRRLFLELADMEDQHHKIFGAIKSHPDAGEAKVLSRQEQSQWLAVATALLQNLEADLVKRFGTLRDPREILRQAMAYEKDTVVFFLALKNMIPAESDRQRVDAILKEELGHLLLLSSQFAQY